MGRPKGSKNRTTSLEDGIESIEGGIETIEIETTGLNTDSTGTTQEGSSKEKPNNSIPRLPIKKISKKEQQNTDLEKNICTILNVVFMLTKEKYGEIWSVSDGEIESIGKPLASIINQLPISDKINNYSVYLTLLISVSIVVVPRLILTQKMEGAKKHEQKTETKTNNARVIEFNKSNDQQKPHASNASSNIEYVKEQLNAVY